MDTSDGKVLVAIISPNAINYDDLGDYVKPFMMQDPDFVEVASHKKNLADYLEKVVEPFVEWIRVSKDTLMVEMGMEMMKEYQDQDPDKYIFNSEVSYQTASGFTEILSCYPFEEELVTEPDPNHLGSLMSLKQRDIFGKCVVLGNRWVQDVPNLSEMCDVTMRDITRCIERRFLACSYLVHPDGKVQKWYSQESEALALFLFGEGLYSQNSHINHGHVLKFHYHHSNEGKKNKIATRLSTNKKYHGPVLITFNLKEGVDVSLSRSYFLALDKASKDNLTNPDQDWERLKEEYNCFSPISLVKHRASRPQKCGSCGEEAKLKLCASCHRVGYCSRECQTKDWPDHSKCCAK